MPQLTERNQLK